MKTLLLGLLTAFLFNCCYGQGTILDPTTKKSFPAEVSFSHEGTDYHLNVTGSTARRMFTINIYAIAHYMDRTLSGESDEIFQSILSDENAKQVTLIWMHNATAKQIQDSYLQSFQKVLSKREFASLRDDIDQFVSFFKQDALVDDQYIFRWIPGGLIEMDLNGSKSSISNTSFANALWSIWFGPQSVLNREQLISSI